VTGSDEAIDLPDAVAGWVGQARYQKQAQALVAAANVHALCAAVEDANPVWWDGKAAIELLGAEITPPAMVSSWTRPELWHPDNDTGVMPLQLHYDLKAAFDYPTALVSGFESVFYQPVVIGDCLSSSQLLREVSAEKTTRLGRGRFWVIEVQYHNQHGELAATEQFDCFGYRREVAS
jgi:acyl dehydratase